MLSAEEHYDKAEFYLLAAEGFTNVDYDQVDMLLKYSVTHLRLAQYIRDLDSEQ